MPDKTTLGISDTFREYIEALVEEVVINGEPFEAQKKWLRKNSENEGVDYTALEKNLMEFFEAIDELRIHESKSGERLAKKAAKECYLEEGEADNLISSVNKAREEAKAKVERKEDACFKKCTSIAACDAYLKAYHAAQVMAKKVELKKIEVKAETEREEDAFFKKCTSIAACDVYLKAYPQGRYAAQVLAKKVEFEGIAAEAEAKREEDAKRHSRLNTIPELIAPVLLNHQWCLIDNEGYTVRNLPYTNTYTNRDEISPFYEGFARVRHQSSIGYINKEGKEIIPIVYQNGSDFSGQRVAVKKGPSWGYLNTSGNVAIPFEYENARDFSEGLAAVKKNDKWGYIDDSGKTVIPFIFDNAKSFSQGLAAVRFEDGYVYINKTGQVAIPAKNEGNGIGRFLQKQIRSLSGKPTLRNIEGESVKSLPFHDAWGFSEGVAVVEVKEGEVKSWQRESYRYRFIDKRGKFLQFSYCDNSFGFAGGFSSGITSVSKGEHVSEFDFFAFQKKGDFGYIDNTGKSIYGFHLNDAYPFIEGLARVGFNEGNVRHSGFIDKSGTLVIDYKQEDPVKEGDCAVYNGFSFGLTPVGKIKGYRWKYGYINKKGDVVIPFRYDEACRFGK